MRNLAELIIEILPPNDYNHRNGFSNDHFIDNLSDEEKIEVEKELLRRLENSDDLLIAETLGYMKSLKAIEPMKKELKKSKIPTERITLASIIYNIDQSEKEMVEIAIEEFSKIKEKYSLISMFYYLSRFQDVRINERIRQYHNHNDYIISYNAKLNVK